MLWGDPSLPSVSQSEFSHPDDDIRQNEGFKNVSLGNVLSASAVDKRVTFIGQDEQV